MDPWDDGAKLVNYHENQRPCSFKNIAWMRTAVQLGRCCVAYDHAESQWQPDQDLNQSEGQPAAMILGRRGLLGYAIIQLIGEIGQWVWPAFGPGMGPWFFGLGLVLLLPGNQLGGYLIERVLWGKGLTILQLSILQIPLELGINLVVWMA